MRSLLTLNRRALDRVEESQELFEQQRSSFSCLLVFITLFRELLIFILHQRNPKQDSVSKTSPRRSCQRQPESTNETVCSASASIKEGNEKDRMRWYW